VTLDKISGAKNLESTSNIFNLAYSSSSSFSSVSAVLLLGLIGM